MRVLDGSFPCRAKARIMYEVLWLPFQRPWRHAPRSHRITPCLCKSAKTPGCRELFNEEWPISCLKRRITWISSHRVPVAVCLFFNSLFSTFYEPECHMSLCLLNFSPSQRTLLFAAESYLLCRELPRTGGLAEHHTLLLLDLN
jgi:hypothetical protein